jgi:hypothetical protein
VISTTVTSQDLADLALAIRFEQDGAVMRRELLQELRKASRPAKDAAKASILSMSSSGLRTGSSSLRQAIAKEIRQETRLTGKSAKVKIKVRKQQIRGFKNPAKHTNSAKGWRHPVFPQRGREGETTWVRQVGKPGWFDDEMQRHREEYRAAVKAAMDRTAARIARNT